MQMRYIVLFILSICGIILIDFASILFALSLFITGSILVKVIFKSNTKYHLKLYQVSFIIGLTYLILCYAYMKFHNYEYLLGIDSIGAFIPKTKDCIDNSNDFFSAVAYLFKDFSFFNRDSYGYYVGAILFGLISKFLKIDIYFSLQLYSLVFGAFISNLLFILFDKNGFNFSKSYKYSIVIFVVSPILFYSTIVARDIHVTLLYLIAINLTLTRKLLLKNIFYLFIVILICTTFRVESGLFLLILIPTYLILTLQNKRQRGYVIFISLVIGIIFLGFIISNYDQIQSTYIAYEETYVEGTTEETGVISTLQQIPIAGDFASIVYNAIQPLPFWTRFSPELARDKKHGQETYNVMNFPKSFSSFFHWFVIVNILFWIFSKELKRKTKDYISKPLNYHLWIGLIFLFLQSAVISQRRLLGYYCVFYILFFIIYEHISLSEKKLINATTIISFVILQITGVLYLMEL